jgi:hypothetical protein
MRNAAILLSAALLFSPARASDAPLPPGKPAGVKPAIGHDTEIYILFGTAAIATAAGLILFARTSKSSSTASTATSP